MTYISKEDAIRLITDYQGGAMDKVTAKKLLAEMEEGIVRCKDCKHGMYDVMCKFYWCHGVAHSANWFCADAERREDG